MGWRVLYIWYVNGTHRIAPVSVSLSHFLTSDTLKTHLFNKSTEERSHPRETGRRSLINDEGDSVSPMSSQPLVSFRWPLNQSIIPMPANRQPFWLRQQALQGSEPMAPVLRQLLEPLERDPNNLDGGIARRELEEFCNEVYSRLHRLDEGEHSGGSPTAQTSGATFDHHTLASWTRKR